VHRFGLEIERFIEGNVVGHFDPSVVRSFRSCPRKQTSSAGLWVPAFGGTNEGKTCFNSRRFSYTRRHVCATTSPRAAREIVHPHCWIASNDWGGRCGRSFCHWRCWRV